MLVSRTARATCYWLAADGRARLASNAAVPGDGPGLLLSHDEPGVALSCVALDELGNYDAASEHFSSSRLRKSVSKRPP
jgi:hypothetical protein